MSTVISYKGVIPAGALRNAGYKMALINGGGSGGSAVPIPVAVVLHDGVNGTAYSETISAQGGTSPYTFSLLSGSLPTGTSLNTSTGVISGTPSAIGSFSFTIKATDARLAFGSQNFSITVAAAPSSGGGSYIFLG